MYLIENIPRLLVKKCDRLDLVSLTRSLSLNECVLGEELDNGPLDIARQLWLPALTCL